MQASTSAQSKIVCTRAPLVHANDDSYTAAFICIHVSCGSIWQAVLYYLTTITPVAAHSYPCMHIPPQIFSARVHYITSKIYMLCTVHTYVYVCVCVRGGCTNICSKLSSKRKYEPAMRRTTDRYMEQFSFSRFSFYMYVASRISC